MNRMSKELRCAAWEVDELVNLRVRLQTMHVIRAGIVAAEFCFVGGPSW